VKRALLLLALLPAAARGEDLTINASNLFRWGSGNETVGTVSRHRDYFENLTDTRIGYSDFLVGFRLLFDLPPEYGVEYSGVQKIYVEWRRDDLAVRGGSSYSLFGRGLALNLFEDRALAFDTGINGLKAEYQTRIIRALVTGGDIIWRDNIDLSRTEKYRVRAGTLELSPYTSLTVGASIVSGQSSFPPPTFPDQLAQFDIPEYFTKFRVVGVDGYVSYAEKRTTVQADTVGTVRGTGFYASLSHTGEGFGVSAEYKDYRFGITDPYQRNNPNRANKALAFQNPPTVHKEHTFTLLSRYPHVVDFNDEVGMQLDVFYTIGQLTGSVNGSVASRHYAYAPTGDTNALFLPVYQSAARSGSFLPSMNQAYSPFWEVYLDGQYFLEEGGNDYVLLGFNRRSQDVANELSYQPGAGPAIEETRLTGIPLAVQYTIGGGWVAKGVLEQQWVHDGKNLVTQDYTNTLVSLGVSSSPDYSLTLRYEWTSDGETVDGRKDWFAVDAALRISRSHSATLTVGGDRGGQVCANGVCRIVNPFLGVRASLLSYF
jgi:hypothetical protein